MTIGGIAQQMWQMSRLAAIADTGPPNQREGQITSMSGVQRAGTLAGPLAGGLVGELIGLRVPFLIFGFMALFATVPSYFLIKETSPTVLARRAGAAKSDVDTSWSKLFTRPVATYSLQNSGQTWGGAVRRGQGGPYFIFAAFAFGWGPATLGTLSVAAGVIGVPITLMAGQVMDRFGRKRTIVPASSLLGMGLVLMVTLSALELPPAVFVVAFIWINLLVSMMAGSMQTLGLDVAPAEARGKFFGVNRLVAEEGPVSNPASFGVVAAFVSGAAGFAGAFAIMAGGAFISSALVGLLLVETLQKDLEAPPGDKTSH
jgi:MFS family permease